MNLSSSVNSSRLNSCLRLLLLLLTGACALAAPQAASAQTAAPEADLTITKTGDESARLGGTITYDIVVSNGGPDTAMGVVVTDSLPEHTSFVSASPSQGGSFTFENNTLTVNLGDLNAFESTSVQLVVMVDSDTPRGTIISNTADVTSDTHDPELTSNSSTAQTAVTGAFAGDLIISEFRLRGPSGSNDEYIEVYNNTATPHIVNAPDGSEGYSIAASDGVVRCVIPNQTVIPTRGHFLCVNSIGYTLESYPAGVSGTALGDATYETDIPDNIGIALFRTSNPKNFDLSNRLDAVGSTSEENTLYKEGAGYPRLSPLNLDYALYRDTCGKGGSPIVSGLCPTGGLPKETDDNAADFIFVDTGGNNMGAGRRLGSPGPKNLSSPTQLNTGFFVSNLDATKSVSVAPNRVRDFSSDPQNNSTFGTLELRKRVTNNTDETVTRLRFRIVDITTFPVPSGFADLRPRTSTATVVSGVDDETTCAASEQTAPCTVTVEGTTLETPPAQPNGGGFNSSLSADTINLETPLLPGASVNVRFLLGIQQSGNFRFFFNIEALTGEPPVPEERPQGRPSPTGIPTARPLRGR